MVVQVAAVHQVQNEAQFVWSVEGVRHAYDERTIRLLRQKKKIIRLKIRVHLCKSDRN